MEIDKIQIMFQSVVSQFVADRDLAVSKINRSLSDGSENAEEIIISQMRELTLAKLNIVNTQEELKMIQNKYMAAMESKQAAAEKASPNDSIDSLK